MHGLYSALFTAHWYQASGQVHLKHVPRKTILMHDALHLRCMETFLADVARAWPS